MKTSEIMIWISMLFFSLWAYAAYNNAPETARYALLIIANIWVVGHHIVKALGK